MAPYPSIFCHFYLMKCLGIFFFMNHSCSFFKTLTRITFVVAAAAAKSLQLCPTLCNPIDGSPPGSSVPGILQARTQEWVAISFSKRNYRKKESEVAQLSPTVCDPVDCSLPGSSIHGISQARVLEGVAMSFSMRSPYSTLILSIPPLQEPILLSILLFWGLGGSYYLLMGVFP